MVRPIHATLRGAFPCVKSVRRPTPPASAPCSAITRCTRSGKKPRVGEWRGDSAPPKTLLITSEHAVTPSQGVTSAQALDGDAGNVRRKLSEIALVSGNDEVATKCRRGNDGRVDGV